MTAVMGEECRRRSKFVLVLVLGDRATLTLTLTHTLLLFLLESHSLHLPHSSVVFHLSKYMPPLLPCRKLKWL